MPRKPKSNEPFNQSKYVNDWAKQNMKGISVSYKREFVDEFKVALRTLGLKQSEVFRKTMEDVIQQAKQNAPED